MPRRKRLSQAEARARTRQHLLDAAGELILRNGLSTMTLDQIADYAGMTKGAVYSNFENKEDLFVAILEQATPTTVDLSMFADSTLGEDEQLKRFSHALADSNREAKAVAANLETSAYAIRNDRARPRFAEMMRNVIGELAAGMEAGADPLPVSLSATEVVVLVDALTLGLYVRRAINPELVPDELFHKAMRALAVGMEAMN